MTLRSKGKPVRRSGGAAMLLVLIAVAMCTILALSFLAAQEPTALVASNIDRKTQARQIAESALKMAIDYVNEDADWRTDKSSGQWMSNISLDGGTFTLSGTDEADGDLADDTSEAVLLTVVASYQGVTHRVSARVTPGAEEATANRLLFVAGNGSSLSTQDTNKRTLFESWGYTITVIDDAAGQATYDAAAALNDVAFVSEEVSSGNVGTKLRSATIGVVCDEGYLFDSFGFLTSDASSSSSDTATDIINTSHEITSIFSSGTLTILSSSISIQYATSTIASGVTVLAERPSSSSANLMVADTGDTLHYGTAEGRRVMFLGNTALDVNDLTSDGQSLLQRSIAWAAGGSTTPSGDNPTLLALYEFSEQAVAAPTLVGHWKLDDEGSGGGSGMVFANDDIDFTSGTVIDSYNSSAGAYGGSNIGSEAIVVTNSSSSSRISGGTINGDAYCDASATPSSVITSTVTGTKGNLTSDLDVPSYGSPSGSFTSMGTQTYSGGSQTWSSNLEFNELNITNNCQVTVTGDVTIHIGTDFLLDNGADINLDPGASLTMYIDDKIEIKNGSTIGTSDEAPSIRIIRYSTTDTFIIDGSSTEVTGIIESEGDVTISGGAQIYGSIEVADDLYVNDGSDIHVDIALDTYGGEPVTFGNTSSSGSSYDTAENDQAATQFTLTEAMTVTSMSAYLWGADDGGDVRFAIYEDSSGSPGALIAESNRESLREESWGWETEPIGPVNLSAGTYWLALSIEGDDGTARYRYQSGGTTRHNTNNGVDNGFNDPWGASSSTLSHTISIYASGTSSGGGLPAAILDETATANAGTANDVTPEATGFGDGGTSFEFDGSNDYIEIPHDSTYLLDEGSVSFHFYPTDLGGEQGLFSKDSTYFDNGGHLTVYTDGTSIKVRLQTDGSNPFGTGDSITAQSASGLLSDDTWHHAAITWGDGELRLYLDGTLVASETHLGGLGTTSGGSGNDEPITIGVGSDTSGNQSATPVEHYFTGRVDDVRIYDLPLDATQAANLAGGSDPGSRTAPGYVIADTSGYGTAADMVVYDTTAITWPGSGGLQFTGDTIATTHDYATKLHDAIEANGEFAVEVLLTRATPGTTSNPSHVVSYADGATAHNFLLGQDSAKAEARVRDSSTGTTGVLSPELLSSSDLASSGDTHIVLSYSSGTVSIYIDGSLDSTGSAGGTLNNWDNDHFLIFGGSYTDANHWRGTLKRVAIYDNSFNAIQANNVFNGNDPGSGASGASGAGSVEWDEQD
ncbi:MAG: LamG-like jellyroll fold domain-containing protein [Planctomycetota bacterium]